MTNSHADEAGKSALSILAVLIVLFIIGWNISDNIIAYLLAITDFTVITVAPLEMVQTKFTVSTLFALFASLPYIYTAVYMFISPALYEKETKIIKLSTIPFFIMFSVGITFALKIFLPVVLAYANLFYLDGISNTVTLSNYISFLLSAMALFGAVFCMPVVLSILSYIGVIDYQSMKTHRRQVYVGLLIIGAIVTPPDAFSQLLVSVPLAVLYELSVVISYFITKEVAVNAGQQTKF